MEGKGPYAQKSQALYYHQLGDQKYAQYSTIIRQPAFIITNHVTKSTPSTPKLFGNLPLLPPTRWSKVRPVVQNYSATCRY